MKLYGKASLEDGFWQVTGEPHMLLRLKRAIGGVDKDSIGVVKLSCTPEHCRELEWFSSRFPIDFGAHQDTLTRGAQSHRDELLLLENILAAPGEPKEFELAIPPRAYQAQAAELLLKSKALLLADELGLGKTCVAISTFAKPETIPALVVAPAHLCAQWEREIRKFAPNLRVHQVKKSVPYPIPREDGKGPDVFISSYHKIHGWAVVMQEACKSVVFDEIHELRNHRSRKSIAAKEIARSVDYRLGLSATPIFNYGGEIFRILDVLKPGALGTWGEFTREWCKSAGSGKWSVRKPRELGSHLRSEFLMLRRTRKEVGSELPAVTKVVHTVDIDDKELAKVQSESRQLAKIILGQVQNLERGDRMRAAQELDWRLRQATGISKARFVASFVQMLVESGEPVVLVGWHQSVYDVWAESFGKAGVKWAKYTGSESVSQKDEAVRAFTEGRADVLMLSLRSGAGLNGLEERASVIVFGELDWSPSVHEQCVGRLHRGNQTKGVMSYYLVSDHGSDPVIAQVLGLKRDQLKGLRDPHADIIERTESSGDRMRELAMSCLKRSLGPVGLKSKAKAGAR